MTARAARAARVAKATKAAKAAGRPPGASVDSSGERGSRDSVAEAHFEGDHGGSLCGSVTRLVPCPACLERLLVSSPLHVQSPRNPGRVFCGVDLAAAGVRSCTVDEFGVEVSGGAVPCPGCSANYARYVAGVRERSSRLSSASRVSPRVDADAEDEIE